MADVLDQDKAWTTHAGIRMTLEEMDPGHRANVIAMLERQAEARQFSYTFNLTFAIARYGIDGNGSEMVMDMLDGELREIEDTPPVEWIRSTKLYRRLAELNAEADAERRKIKPRRLVGRHIQLARQAA